MTTGGAIRTERLTLRPLRPEDAPAVTEGIGRWDVMQWLTSPPWPFALADAAEFIASPMSEGAMGMVLGDAVIGVVHIAPSGELGYWLNPDHHRQGYMTEAATALVAAHFAVSERDLASGHLPGNGPSARVLQGLGFRYVEPARRLHRALGREVTVERMVLTAAEWRARCAS